jgi:hypothetical protein
VATLIVLGSLVYYAVDQSFQEFLGAEQVEFFHGSGTIVTEQRGVAGFDAIHLSGAGTLHIIQGATETLTIRTHDNILPLVRTLIRDGTLHISINHAHPGRIRPAPIYEVSVISLRSLSVTGFARAETTFLSTDDLRLEAIGAFARLALDGLQVSNLRASISHGGVWLTGAVDTQEIEVSGLGTYEAARLQSRTATVHVTAQARAIVRVSDTLNASADDFGEIEYFGQPTAVHVTGNGTVRQVES